MNDAVVISDVSLGSDNGRAKHPSYILAAIRRGRMPTRTLVLNCDVFDSHDSRH